MPRPPPPSKPAATSNQPASVASLPPMRPTHEQIAKRAYELFLARGGQHGHHEEDWRHAERELTLGRQ